MSALQVLTDLKQQWTLLWANRGTICDQPFITAEHAAGALKAYLQDAAMEGLETDDASIEQQDLTRRVPIKAELRMAE